MNSFKSVHSYLPTNLPASEDPLIQRPAMLNKLKDAWFSHAGELALHSHTALFESGRLLVFCYSPAWATKVRHQAGTLQTKLVDDGIPVTSIRSKLIFDDDYKPRIVRPAMMISSQNIKMLAASSETVTHSGLKKALKQLASANSRRNEKWRKKHCSDG